MITIKDIADDNTSISSTRWAFASVIKFDIFVILGTIIVYIVGHFINKPFDSGLFSGVSILLGILTGLITTSKALQGFEPHNKIEMPKENSEDVKTGLVVFKNISNLANKVAKEDKTE